ncbi:MAG TPA: hypothetical protein VFG62_25970 [Rhodopila sp.]|jgi:hypothetical protein|nr:hypothetical protein [Rhodopila sp.]
MQTHTLPAYAWRQPADDLYDEIDELARKRRRLKAAIEAAPSRRQKRKLRLELRKVEADKAAREAEHEAFSETPDDDWEDVF